MTDGIRTLILTPDYPPSTGGIQLVIGRLAEGLDPARTRVVTLGVAGAREFDARHSPSVVRVGAKGGRFHRLSVARLNARALAEAARFRPQAVISGHVTAAPAALAIAALARPVAIQYVHADEFRTRPGLCARAVRRADAVIAVSRYARDLALDVGAPVERVTVIPPGVDAAEAPRRDAAARPTIVTVARLVEHKGHVAMIRALPSIRSRVPEVEWTVIGDGPLRADLERLAVEEGVEDRIRFLGSLSNAERDAWLARAHVFAMPSRLPPGGIGGEGFGIVFLEAGAHGLPVVGPNVGGALDAIVDGETGLLVDPTDPAALADAISTVLLEPALAARLGEAGATRARERTWERHAASVRALIGELVGDSEGRRR